VALNGSVFMKEPALRQLVDKKFEYVHSDQNSSIFKNLAILMKEKDALPEEFRGQSDFMEKIKFALRGETNPEDMLMQTKFYTVITLKQILCPLLTNLVGANDLEKTSKLMQVIFNTIIQILQNDKKAEKQSGKNEETVVMMEFITEYFASTVERSHSIDAELIKPYRRDIIDLFNNDNFFQVSMLNLRQWQKIMKYFIDGKPEEILQEQMQLWNFQGGLFANNNTVIVQKCYAMKRIAFLIFSSEDDDFQNQLDQLMKKMIEVFKSKQKNDIKQRLFLFFLTRVMLIRLNFQTLTEALRKLWPHLLNELISVFEVKDEAMDKENTDLTIEAIKLVELLSSLNIEDFQMNQWIFLIDGYGMKLENQQADQRQKKLGSNELHAAKASKQAPVQNVTKRVDENVEVFKTFIVRFIGNQEYSFYNVDDPPLEGESEEESMLAPPILKDQDGSIVSTSNLGRQPQSELGLHSASSARQITTGSTMGTARHGDVDAKLQEQACSLQQSINDSNVIGNEFNRQEAEAKIELDFLRNDEMLSGQRYA
jgi:hypothetical protein